jgi:hypothetical protein
VNELKKINKSEADRIVKIKIRAAGFTNQRAGGKFFEQIVKPEYRRLFEGSNLRIENDGVIRRECVLHHN